MNSENNSFRLLKSVWESFLNSVEGFVFGGASHFISVIYTLKDKGGDEPLCLS